MSLIERLAARLTGPALGYVLIALIVAVVGLGASVAGNLLQWRRTAVERADVAAMIARAADANLAQRDAIARAREALARCEAGRLLDASAQARVLADHSAQFEVLTRRAAAARAAAQASNAGVCRAWAQQPACGVTP